MFTDEYKKVYSDFKDWWYEQKYFPGEVLQSACAVAWMAAKGFDLKTGKKLNE